MTSDKQAFCPDCDSHQIELDRRSFIRVIGGGAAATVLASSTSMAGAPEAPGSLAKREPRPAEALVRELYDGMDGRQREKLVLPWNHGQERGWLTRQRLYNRSLGETIGDSYTEAQRELIERILQAMSSGEEGYEKITRRGRWDSPGGINDCGAHIFGDPNNGKQFSFAFTGHHITVRCDGNSEPNAAFGGPIFYGHLPSGYSRRNVFFSQTQSALSFFESLTQKQRTEAVVTGTPGEGERSVQFRPARRAIPGISGRELSSDQRRHLDTVMRNLLSPYRKEDVDEVMTIVDHNGGLDQIHMAFYRTEESDAKEPWHFWRLEGPGFVWSFRVLPHVHTYVNIAAKQKV